jgi:hypothetical protein
MFLLPALMHFLQRLSLQSAGSLLEVSRFNSPLTTTIGALQQLKIEYNYPE